MFGYDSYGRKIGDGGYSRVTDDGMPYADDGMGDGNLDRYSNSKPKGRTNSFGNLGGVLIIFCLFIYGFPVAPKEIKWIMVVALLLIFRKIVFSVIRGFFRWLH